MAFAYDANGDLTDYVDANDGAWRFTYQGHLLKTMRRPGQAGVVNPAVVTNVYDTGGRVTSQTDELQRLTTLNYSPVSAGVSTTTVTDPDGHVTVEEYKNYVRTKLTRGVAPNASTWAFETDPYTFGITKVTDPLNRVAKAAYDRHGNLTSYTNALGHVASATYNGFDEPLTVTDLNQITTTHVYDVKGNVKSVSTPLTGTSLLHTTAYNYDADPARAGDLTSVTDGRGEVWLQQEFNSSGQPTRRLDPLANTTRFGFDPATGWLSSQVSPRGSAAGVLPGCTPPAMGCTTFERDDLGRVTAVTDANAHRATNHYDGDGNLDRSTDAEANQTTFVHDAAGQRLEVRRADTPQTVTKTAYYGDGAVKTTTDGAGNITTYTYDGQGRLATVKDPGNRVTAYGYDPAGNLVTKADSGGTCPAWPITYPPALSTSARCTVMGYDAADRLISVTYSDGLTPNVTSVVYDNGGRRTAMITGGATSRWKWDSLGRLTETSTDGVDNKVSYTYANLRDPATSITYPGTPTRTLVREFDKAGSMNKETDWVGNVTNFVPDADANLSRTVFPPASGLSDSFAYDNAGQLQSVTAKSGTTTRSSLTYGRDDAGQVTSVSSTGAPADNRSYTYTALNQLKNDGPATDYGYDAADNLRLWADATTQAFDPANRLISTEGPASQSWGLSSDVAVPADYDGDGKADLAVWRSGTWHVLNSTGATTAVSLGVPGDVAVPADYDGDGRADMAVFRPSVGGWYLRYATGATATTYWGQNGDVAVPADYDGDGKADIALWRPSSATWLVLKSSGGTSSTAWGVGGTTPDAPVPADYDGDAKADVAVWRPSVGAWYVIKSSDATTTVTFLGSPGDKPAPGDYDGDAKADPSVFRPGVGAWYVRSATGTTENIHWGLPNDTPVPADYDGDRTIDIAVWRPAGGTWFTRRSSSSAYAYDTRGNRTSRSPLAGAPSAYGYDQANRLISAPGATYAYDGDGLRTSKTVAGTTARFTWDTSGGMAMLLDDGTNSYIYGPDGLPLEQIDRAGVVTWYHHDQLGSTRTLTSSTGAVVGTATYDSYGRLAAHTGTLSRFGFAGEYTDAETGFVYLRARYYDPATGQFMSRDPLVALTGSAYGYVDGNPLNWTDPTGLAKCQWCANLAGGVLDGLTLGHANDVLRLLGQQDKVDWCSGESGTGRVVGIGLLIAPLLARGRGSPAALPPNPNIARTTELAEDWLGPNVRAITNRSGDKVFLSNDGLRRIRFDINNPTPHSSPHAHIEELINGKWVKSGPIYPTDVPHR